MNPGIALSLMLIALALIAGPALAVAALVELRHARRRIAALTATVADLGRRLDALQGSDVSAASTDAPRATAPAPTPPRPRTVATPARAKPGTDLESLIGGRWLNRVGVVAMLLAVGFFLKYAFDNDWIGPTGRVILGLVGGIALIVYSHRLLGRGYRYFSEGISALGAGTLYLSIYAAWGFYRLVPQVAAFSGMIAVTVAMAAIALGRNTQRLAMLVLVGGMMTPGVLSTGTDQQVVLFGYLIVLNAGLVFLGYSKGWRLLEPLALAGTLFYFAGWFESFYEPAKLAPTLIFAALLFLEFSAITLWRARRGAALFVEQPAIVVLNAVWFTALLVALYIDQRWTLTLAVLALAAGHLAVMPALPGQSGREKPTMSRLLYGGLALGLANLAVPIRLEPGWIALAWALESALLVGYGFRGSMRALRVAGLVVLGLAVLALGVQDVEGPLLLLNLRFAAFAATVGALVFAYKLARRHETRLAAVEKGLLPLLAVAAGALGVVGLSLEVWDAVGRVGSAIDVELARQMGLSILWTVYAVVLTVAGVRSSSRILRYQGLALLGLVIAKVFLFDLSFLARVYRVLSFFALGMVALIVSFLYQRAATRADEPDER